MKAITTSAPNHDMTQEQFTCRWAALSLSSIAATFLPDLLLTRRTSSSVKHELVAVSTTGTRDRATNWLQENKIPNSDSIKIYHSWQEMLEKGDFDVVYISTPHPLHYQHVLQALESKRNVLLEKPATMNRAQYQRAIELAKKNNVVLMEAMWTRYLPATEYFKKSLLPKIGEVKRVYSEFSFPIYSPEMPHSSRFLDKAAGAGSLLDQGVYALTWVDLAFNGLEEPGTTTKVIHANSMPVPGVPGDVDDIDTVILSKESGNKQTAVAILTTAMTIPGSNKPAFYRRLQAGRQAPAVRIEGTKGSVAVPFPPIRPQELHVQWYAREYVDKDGIETEETIRKPVDGWGIWYQADVIAQRVEERKKQGSGTGEVIGEEESLRVLDWLDQARQQAGIKYDVGLDET